MTAFAPSCRRRADSVDGKRSGQRPSRLRTSSSAAGVRVNAVAPAFIATPMVERFVGLLATHDTSSLRCNPSGGSAMSMRWSPRSCSCCRTTPRSQPASLCWWTAVGRRAETRGQAEKGRRRSRASLLNSSPCTTEDDHRVGAQRSIRRKCPCAVNAPAANAHWSRFPTLGHSVLLFPSSRSTRFSSSDTSAVWRELSRKSTPGLLIARLQSSPQIGTGSV